MMELLDFVQEGNLGLLQALENYDATKGEATFRTFAFSWIRCSMLAAFWQSEGAIHLPQNKVRAMKQMGIVNTRLLTEFGYEPAIAETAQAMGLSEHFELLFKVPSSSAPNTPRKCPDKLSPANCVDYLYSPSLDQTGVAHGLWGIFRSYDPTKLANKLAALPSNPVSPSTNVTYSTCLAILTAPSVKRTSRAAR